MLTGVCNWHLPQHSAFERRQALVDIDVFTMTLDMK